MNPLSLVAVVLSVSNHNPGRSSTRVCRRGAWPGLALSLLAGPTLAAVSAGSTGCADVAPTVDMTGAVTAVCSQAGLVNAIQASSTGRVKLPAACSITLTQPISIDKNVQIDANGATLSGNNATRIFDVHRNRSTTVNSGYSFTLLNATLRNGYDSGITDADGGGGGGAVRGAQFGNLSFYNVQFLNNQSAGLGGEDGGGAIYKGEGGRLTIFNAHFDGNTATNGGAVKSLLANVWIVNASFTNNVARGGNNGGGAVFIDGLAQTKPKPWSQGGYAPNNYVADTFAKARVCGAYFAGNSVGGSYDFNQTGRQGGGLFTHTYSLNGATAIEVERSVFDGNKSAADGGALRLGGDGVATGVAAKVFDSLLRNNRAGNHGGAVRLSLNAANFSNLTVADNCANVDGNVANCVSTSTGGGIGGGIVSFDRVFNLTGVTLIRNRSASYGGAMSLSAAVGQGGTVASSIFANNTAGNPYGTAQNCSPPAFNGGSASYQYPAPQFNTYDPGCADPTKIVSTVNPNYGTTPTVCTGRVAGSSYSNAPMSIFVPGAAVLVNAGTVVPKVGARCPT